MKRLWALPLWAHALGLAVVLLVLTPIVDPQWSYSADEGAAITQARTLARDGEWIRPHPLPELDAEGRLYPLENAGGGPDGRAPFVHHPLYALVLAGADQVGGVTAMVLLSLAGTVTAAVLAALLARRVGRGLDRVSLWTVGAASPLLFDGYLVIAHTLGAVCAGIAALAALAFLDGRRRWAPALVVAVIVGVLLRAEVAIFAGALAAALVIAGWRHARWATVALAGTTVVAAAATRVGEAAWQAAILGGGEAASAGLRDTGGGLLDTRLDAFTSTWLAPSDGSWSTGDSLLMLMLVMTMAAAVEVRRRQAPPAAVLAAAAALLALGRLLVEPADAVPGLLVAFPLVAFGLVLIERPGLLGWTSGLFVLGVLATQYSRGGTTEWGGRYFALALPLAVPVLLLGIRDRVAAVDVPVRKAVAAALAVQAAALGAVAITALRVGHQRTADLLQAVEAVQSGDRPVVITGNGAVPRLAWPLLDEQRWLLVQGVDLRALATRLRDAGVDELTVVDPISDDRLRRLPGYGTVSERGAGRATRWRVTVLRAT